jgi:hypothetical protein
MDNKKLILILAALGIGVAAFYVYNKSKASAANAAAIAARIPSLTQMPIILPTGNPSINPSWFLLPETPADIPTPSIVDNPTVVYKDLNYSINPNEYIS